MIVNGPRFMIGSEGLVNCENALMRAVDGVSETVYFLMVELLVVINCYVNSFHSLPA